MTTVVDLNDRELLTIRTALLHYAGLLSPVATPDLLGREEIDELVHTLGPCGGYAMGEHSPDCDCAGEGAS